MGGRSVRFRVLGLASTTRGFAFALLEGPDDLVDWGLRRMPATKGAAKKRLTPVLRLGQPTLIVIEEVKGSRKRHRGRNFFDVVTELAESIEVPVNALPSAEIQKLSDSRKSTKWDVAAGTARRFPEIALRLPPRRKPWQSEDDRVGLFLAVGSGVAAWRRLGTMLDS